ncbi:MAG: Maf family protein [Cyclobacteriaceae bacterium]|nr:MAG: Maf family protein [Cyclobacteriaceae bacterium]
MFSCFHGCSRCSGLPGRKKARVFESELKDEVVVASDTVVILNNEILNKPINRQDAIHMLSRLSGKTHTVVTAVCLLSKTKESALTITHRLPFVRCRKMILNITSIISNRSIKRGLMAHKIACLKNLIPVRKKR